MSQDRQSTDFIRAIIDADLAAGTHPKVATRFPPEPNGYLHIGHAKSICLNFGLAREYGGTCNLRFDDTNPAREDPEYVRSIQEDIRWLGFSWSGEVRHASDYFDRLYELAEGLVRDGKAYVCSLDEADIRAYRGTLSEPGRPSPYRERSVAENLDLLRRMRAGEFPDGAHVLRAKIDMAASNMKMRDPLLYRIRHVPHDRTGESWPIYPMYDYAHPLSDAIEGITHSLCTLEFENNRELYDWIVAHTNVGARPVQLEFARLAIGYTVLSKRKLLRLVEDGHVSGWDDPRMPTLAAMRRRGYTPAAIRALCDMVGIAKHNSTVDMGKLEFAVRDDLNQRAPRRMCVLRPLEVVITNYEGDGERLEVPSFPSDVAAEGSREVPFAGTLYIERDDFDDEPPKGYQRLAPGRWVRLRHAYCIRCDEVVRDEGGAVVQLRCTMAPETRGGGSPADGGKVWGVLHWVPAAASVPCEVRLYDRLFTIEKPDAAGDDFLDYLNPRSLEVVSGARVEPSVVADELGSRYQFERQGYFASDTVDARPGALVFNRVVTLRDTWSAREEAAPAPGPRKSARSKTRPPKKSRAEQRAIARDASPALAARYRRYQDELGLDEGDADVLTGDPALADLFEAVLAHRTDAAEVAKWLLNELPREGDAPRTELPCAPAQLARVIELVGEARISATAGKELFAEVTASGRDPDEVVAERGLEQVSDAGALEPIVEQVLAAHEAKVEAYRGGKTGLLGFFVGQVMKQSGGTANPALVKELVAGKLG